MVSADWHGRSSERRKGRGFTLAETVISMALNEHGSHLAIYSILTIVPDQLQDGQRPGRISRTTPRWPSCALNADLADSKTSTVVIGERTYRACSSCHPGAERLHVNSPQPLLATRYATTWTRPTAAPPTIPSVAATSHAAHPAAHDGSLPVPGTRRVVARNIVTAYGTEPYPRQPLGHLHDERLTGPTISDHSLSDAVNPRN